jgi:hypothetical protein
VRAAAVVLQAAVLRLTAVLVRSQSGAGEAATVAGVEALHVDTVVLARAVAVVGEALVPVQAGVAVIAQVVASWAGACRGG